MSENPCKPTIAAADGAYVVDLCCPSLSLSSKLVVPSGGNEKVDVGAVSRAFGLDPSTVMLNGHYLSRGEDLVSRSLSWSALLVYFHRKGLPSGRGDEGVVVEGKPLRVGSKRAGIDVGVCWDGDFVHKRGKRTGSVHPSLICGDVKVVGGSCSKRKCLLEDTSLLKRLKIDDAPVTDNRHNREGLVPPSSNNGFVCRIVGENRKRVQVDGSVTALPLKRLR